MNSPVNLNGQIRVREFSQFSPVVDTPMVIWDLYVYRTRRLGNQMSLISILLETLLLSSSFREKLGHSGLEDEFWRRKRGIGCVGKTNACRHRRRYVPRSQKYPGSWISRIQDPESSGILDLIFSFPYGILETLDSATATLPWDPTDPGSWA